MKNRRNVALRKESVDRNPKVLKKETGPFMSLSARRAWIEMANFCRNRFCPTWSLSARRAWIEICGHTGTVDLIGSRSPQGERG